MKLRGLIRPTGRHRTAEPTVRLAALFPPAGRAVQQGFRDCPECGATTAAVLHRSSHTCGDCGHTHYPEDGAK